jgi:ankyrin repeat protein
MTKSNLENLSNEELSEALLISLIKGLEIAPNKIAEGYHKSLSQALNFRNSRGENAIHIACRENCVKAVEFFLLNSVDATELNSENQFAIELTDNSTIQNIIKSSNSWKYLEKKFESFSRISAIGSTDFNGGISLNQEWQSRLRKVQNYQRFTEQENSQISDLTSHEQIDKETSQIFSQNFETNLQISNQQPLEINSISLDLIENAEHKKINSEEFFLSDEVNQKSNITEELTTKTSEESFNLNQTAEIKPNENQAKNFQDLYRQEQTRIEEELKAKEADLKIRNRETNLMLKEDHLAKEISLTEKKQQESQQQKEKQRKTAEDKKYKENRESEELALKQKAEDDLIEQAFAESQKEKAQIEASQKQELVALNAFIDEIYQDLEIGKKIESRFEESFEVALPKIVEILGLLTKAAILEKNFAVAEKLMNHYLKDQFINYRDDNQKCSLMYACENESFDIAKLLINNGINVKNFDKNNNNALMFCASKKDQKEHKVKSSDIAKMIISKCNDWSFLSANKAAAFIICCKEFGNWQVLKSLLETKSYKENQQDMPIALLKTFVAVNKDNPSNKSNKINQDTLKLLNIFEKLPQQNLKQSSENSEAKNPQTTIKNSEEFKKLISNQSNNHK